VQVDVSRRQPLRPALELAALIGLNVVESEGRLVVVVGPVGRGRCWEHLAVRADNQGRVLAEPEILEMFIIRFEFIDVQNLTRQTTTTRLICSCCQSRRTRPLLGTSGCLSQGRVLVEFERLFLVSLRLQMSIV
jgi:hypothetical protein